MKSRAARWQEITELKIGPEEVVYLVQEMTRRHDEEEDVDFFTSIAILGERYRGQEKQC
jgi:hypothetical protein